MANKKTINTKSGERLKELIISHDMTYSEFGKSVNLSERTINSYVSNTRRLTEDSARIITQIYPEVRFEWLMGWDDYKTEKEFTVSKIDKEYLNQHQTYFEWLNKIGVVGKALPAFGYKLRTAYFANSSEAEKIEAENYKELWELFKILIERNNEKLLNIFDENELDAICSRLKSELKIITLEETEEDIDYIIEHQGERKQETEELMSYHQNIPLCLCDDDNNKIIEFTTDESKMFIDELYNVVNALIYFHINKAKGEK